MSTKEKQTKKGFTIIEVVLVLAIAALIFLMVFLALPALQRSRRDTQRKDDISRVLAQIQNYQSNHNGKVPPESSIGTFESEYMTASGDAFADPSTGSYNMTKGTNNSGYPSSLGTIWYDTNAKCSDTTDGIEAAGGVNKVAVRMKLEGSPGYCSDNS